MQFLEPLSKLYENTYPVFTAFVPKSPKIDADAVTSLVLNLRPKTLPKLSATRIGFTEYIWVLPTPRASMISCWLRYISCRDYTCSQRQTARAEEVADCSIVCFLIIGFLLCECCGD